MVVEAPYVNPMPKNGKYDWEFLVSTPALQASLETMRLQLGPDDVKVITIMRSGKARNGEKK